MGFIVFVVCIILWNFMQVNNTESTQSTKLDKELKVDKPTLSSSSDIASIKK